MSILNSLNPAVSHILTGAITSYIACIGFGLAFNLRGRRLFLAAIGSAIGWAVYLALDDRIDRVMLSFIAMTVVAVYAEIMAIVDKCPATVYLIIGLLPFVPGAGIYYTMKFAVVDENIDAFIQEGLGTLAISLALAVAVAVVLFIFQLFQQIRRKHREKKDAKNR